MTVEQIYDQMNELLEMIQNNSEDQDCVFNCEMGRALREDLEVSEPGEF